MERRATYDARSGVNRLDRPTGGDYARQEALAAWVQL